LCVGRHHESRSSLNRLSMRSIALAGTICSALCLGYFYLLDHLWFTSAHFSPIFRYLLTTYDRKTAWIALAVCLLSALWRRPAPILRCVDFLGQHPFSVALATVALFALGALFVYHNYPLSMDEYAASFQAKIFASGAAFAQLPRGLIDWLVVRGFNGSFLIASSETGKAIGSYWPGFALLQAPYQFFKVPWLCNASLSGLAIFLVHWITKEITGDRRAGGWAMLFTLSSGAFVADGISYYSMQAHLTANLLFAALVIRPSGYRVFGAGLVGSVALILHNPVPHALFAIPWIVEMGRQRERRMYLLPLLLGYLPGVFLGLGWMIFRADIESGGHNPLAMSSVVHGIFAWPDATLSNMRAAAVAKLWLWTLPCLFVFALIGRLSHGNDVRVRLLAQSAALTFIGYVFVRFDQGHGWGYRYFHSAWGAIPILAACAMADGSERRLCLRSFAGAAAILNFLIVVPFQMNQINEIISTHLALLPSPETPGNNIYFIHPQGGFYAADMVQIDPLLRDRNLFLASRGTELDAQLVLRNWPNAIKVGTGQAADQWYLGPKDQRVPITARKDESQLVFTQIPSSPNAAGR
jgi:hypothetical protein